jgi:hypothetical protein
MAGREAERRIRLEGTGKMELLDRVHEELWSRNLPGVWKYT